MIMLKILTGAYLLLALAVPAQAQSVRGGSDGSGGDLMGSSRDVVIEHLRPDELRRSMMNLTYRIRHLIRSENGRIAGIGAIFNEDEDVVSMFFRNPRLDEILQNVNILRTQGDCEDRYGVGHAGSASRDENIICLSISQLMSVPSEALSMQILALAFHQAFHISAENYTDHIVEENDAKKIQSWILKYRSGFTNLYTDKIGIAAGAFRKLLAEMTNLAKITDTWFGSKVESCKALDEVGSAANQARFAIGQQVPESFQHSLNTRFMTFLHQSTTRLRCNRPYDSVSWRNYGEVRDLTLQEMDFFREEIQRLQDFGKPEFQSPARRSRIINY